MMLPHTPQQGYPEGAAHNSKPIEALRPAFSLSFDNSQTELCSWIAQFKAYYEASRLHVLLVLQQHAFLRQGLHPDVWIAIQQQIDMTTRIFKNDLALDEESCEKFLEDAFQIRYPLLMRRYRFFTYQRQGNQIFTNFYGNLIELANAAQLENMTQSDYLIYRIIAGINDSTAVDKLLSIPLADFTLEEVHRVSVSCESAKNYSGIVDKQQNVSCKVFNKKTSQKYPGKTSSSANDDDDDPNEKFQLQLQSLHGAAKIQFLKDNNKCIRCGQEMHSKNSQCVHLSTTCHRCGKVEHISPVCTKENPISH